MRLGIVNVDRDILRALTAKQFRQWEIYSELEPFDETRQDYRVASIVQMLYNINRGKDAKAITLEEAVIKFGEQEKKPAPKKQTWQQQLFILKLIGAGAQMAPDAPDLT